MTEPQIEILPLIIEGIREREGICLNMLRSNRITMMAMVIPSGLLSIMEIRLCMYSSRTLVSCMILKSCGAMRLLPIIRMKIEIDN